MLFNSVAFIGFFIAVYTAYRLLPFRAQNHLLLAASYAFYAGWNWRFLGLIGLSTAVDFLSARIIEDNADERRRKLALFVSVAVNLGILGTFKYFDFFAESLEALAGSVGLELSTVRLDLALPVGISFYTFQSMAYTIDVYRREVRAERDPLTFALYVAYFPQLVAGPIERARTLLPQLKRERTIGWEDLRIGAWSVLWGYFLKVFVADNLALIVEEVFRPEATTIGLQTLVGLYSFLIQILGDFAGYSFIAIGISRWMGIRLSTNFLFPFLVTNPAAFWQHWHITLSRWLRDYIYLPLGGNRGSRWAPLRNSFITMFLGGLWHGAEMTFVLWGGLHGVILAIYRGASGGFSAVSESLFGAVPRALRTLVAIVVMFHISCFANILFRAESVADAMRIAQSVFAGTGYGPEAWALWTRFAFFSGLFALVHLYQFKAGSVEDLDVLPALLRVPVVAAMIVLLLVWGQFGAERFIYFQF